MSTKTAYYYIFVIIGFPARRIRFRQIGRSIVDDIILLFRTCVFPSRVQQTATCGPLKASRVPHVTRYAQTIYKNCWGRYFRQISLESEWKICSRYYKAR